MTIRLSYLIALYIASRRILYSDTRAKKRKRYIRILNKGKGKRLKNASRRNDD
jgi:hypothetical protein